MGRTGDVARRVHRAYAWALDGQIHYRRSGPAGARSPLLVLYNGTSATALEDFMAEMGGERSVIAPDLPGMGMSDPLQGACDAAAQADALLEVVAELGLGMVDIIGARMAALSPLRWRTSKTTWCVE
jgi:haloalkane dehalogenase